MRSVPAYLLAVLIASVTISLEFHLVAWAGDFMGYSRVSLPGKFLENLLGSVTLLSFIIFAIAVVVAALPFILFYPSYSKQHGKDARNIALVFSLIVAFVGLEVTFGILPHIHIQPRDHLAFAGMSVIPGLLGGWIFHATMVRSSALREG